MNKVKLLSLILLLVWATISPPSMGAVDNQQRTEKMLSASECSPLLNLSKRKLASEEVQSLCDYQGKVILIVNTASKCGFTPQYEGLEKLYEEYKDKGLVILGFPSNDFMGQEPGNEQQIQSFCRLTYSVKFPMFEKTAVAKGTKDPLYTRLAQAAGGSYPRWNFYKYLLDRDGHFVDLYSSMTAPYDDELIDRIKELLDNGPKG